MRPRSRGIISATPPIDLEGSLNLLFLDCSALSDQDFYVICTGMRFAEQELQIAIVVPLWMLELFTPINDSERDDVVSAV